MLQEAVQGELDGQAALHATMDNEHGSNEYNVLVIVDVHLRLVRIVELVFCSFASLWTLRHWDVNLGRYWLIFISCELDLEVELDELFRILWATLHRLCRHHALRPIMGLIVCYGLVWSRVRMENGCRLLGQAAQTLECRLLFVFLLLWED